MSVFFQSCWALPRGSTSTTKTQMGKRRACVYVFMCVSARDEHEAESVECNGRVIVSWLMCRLCSVFTEWLTVESHACTDRVSFSFYFTLCFPIMSVRAWSKMILYIHLDSFWLLSEVYRRCYLYSCSLRLQTLYGKQWLETTEQHYCNHIQSKWLHQVWDRSYSVAAFKVTLVHHDGDESEIKLC